MPRPLTVPSPIPTYVRVGSAADGSAISSGFPFCARWRGRKAARDTEGRSRARACVSSARKGTYAPALRFSVYVRVGAVLQEKFHHLGMARIGCHEQRRVALEVFCVPIVDVRLVLEGATGRVHVAWIGRLFLVSTIVHAPQMCRRIKKRLVDRRSVSVNVGHHFLVCRRLRRRVDLLAAGDLLQRYDFVYGGQGGHLTGSLSEPVPRALVRARVTSAGFAPLGYLVALRLS